MADAAAIDVTEIHEELLQLRQGVSAMNDHLSATSTIDGVDESMVQAQLEFIDAAR